MKRIKYKIMLFLLILIFIVTNYTSLDSFVTKNLSNEESIIVGRVIDGDTIVDSDGLHYRLLGINTPEKGEYLYAEAKAFLEENALNISLIAEKNGKDRYDRELAYLYNENENINKLLVKEGYANYYFPDGRDIHYEEFYNAWEECVIKNVNLCENSLNKCALCIEIKEWNMKEEKIIFYNKCEYDCSLNKWIIKDEGRKKYTFNNFTLRKYNYVSIIVGNKTDTKDKLYWRGETYVWTYTGDTMFLRDEEGKLVLWETKGY
jgi:micrococcal nuclease